MPRYVIYGEVRVLSLRRKRCSNILSLSDYQGDCDRDEHVSKKGKIAMKEVLKHNCAICECTMFLTRMMINSMYFAVCLGTGLLVPRR